MTFEADLKAHLQADSSIQSNVADRIYPLLRPQGSSTPAIVYTRIAGQPQNDLDGLDGSLLQIRVQIDVYSQGFETTRILAELVRTRLQTAAASFRAQVDQDQDFLETDTRLYRTALDCTFWYRTN